MSITFSKGQIEEISKHLGFAPVAYTSGSDSAVMFYGDENHSAKAFYGVDFVEKVLFMAVTALDGKALSITNSKEIRLKF